MRKDQEQWLSEIERSKQGNGSVAIGDRAGQGTQGEQAIAIGNEAGNQSQGFESVATGLLLEVIQIWQLLLVVRLVIIHKVFEE